MKEERYKPIDILKGVKSPDQLLLIRAGIICPYCKKGSKLIDSKKVYGKSHGMMYRCHKCDAHVGCHKDTTISKGRLSNKHLRRVKMTTHKFFDFMWHKKTDTSGVSKQEARTMAYKWLSKAIGIELIYYHIGMMDQEECNRVLKVCKPYYREK